MPLIIKTTPKRPPAPRKGRGGHFDQAVIGLAPVIEKLRAAGCLDIRGLMHRLNEMGLATAIGSPFTFGSVSRTLVRMNMMGLGDAPRAKAQAAKNRAPRSS